MAWRGQGLRFALIIFLVALDQISKTWVLNAKVFNARDCFAPYIACGGIDISPILDLVMVWNRGMSFGLFQSEGLMRWLLVGVGMSITAGFLIWMLRASTLLLATALAFVVAGAVGNLIDRIRFGAVIDFLSLNDIGFAYVFNVADIWVNVGAALLFLHIFVLSPKELTQNGGENDQ